MTRLTNVIVEPPKIFNLKRDESRASEMGGEYKGRETRGGEVGRGRKGGREGGREKRKGGREVGGREGGREKWEGEEGEGTYR